MHITFNGILQWLGFCIATLLATGVLVLGGLNESGASSHDGTSLSHTHQEPR